MHTKTPIREGKARTRTHRDLNNKTQGKRVIQRTLYLLSDRTTRRPQLILCTVLILK